ncbi:uncharacterized protein LOC117503627 [Thalassophryne amazonica]|uniref:uncharacterized protein LOC117503627 n=1 Tax=Thalassophryne amazonica TaxID=390379 RepID=UPI001471821B|nr:uncharacterized protein LOC117503627 [Thalassophryne amazonica]
MHDKTGNEASCFWKSSPSSSTPRPAKPLPAGDQGRERYGAEHNHSDCFPLSLQHLKRQEAKTSQSEISRTHGTTEIKEVASDKVQTDGDINFDGGAESEKDVPQQNKQDKADVTKISICDCIGGCAEGKMSKSDNKGNMTECLSAHTHTSQKNTTVEETKGKEKKEGSAVRGKIKSDGHRDSEETDMTEISPVDWTEGSVTLATGKEEENKHSFFQQVEKEAKCLVVMFPPKSDAAVPSSHDLSLACPLKTGGSNTRDVICDVTFCSVLSNFTLHDRVPEGFDTFEKIQLSPDDEDQEEGSLSSGLLLTSSPGKLLKTVQQQLHHPTPGAESDEHEKVEGSEHCAENVENGFLRSETRSCELSDFIPPEDDIAAGQPEQQPKSESSSEACACFCDDINSLSVSSSASSQSPGFDVLNHPHFEMRAQFDMVLKEMHLFFKISASDCTGDIETSLPEESGDVTEALVDKASNSADGLSSPEQGYQQTSDSDADDNRILKTSNGDTIVSCATDCADGEQKVTELDCSHLFLEEPVCTPENHTDLQEVEKKSKMWLPSFVCRPLLEQLGHSLVVSSRRLEPLKTCTRPIRVGLSKRAKTKHLHRPHPYK